MIQHPNLRTWAELSLDNLAHNYRVLRARLADGCRLMGVVKADGYGHGALAVARELERLGADYLGVACDEEGIALREGGVELPILIFGHTPPELVGELLARRLTASVFDAETAAALSRAAGERGEVLPVHVKVDTGMGRLGFLDAEELTAACRLPNLRVEGVYTHFAAADEDTGYTAHQTARFQGLLTELRGAGIALGLRHCAASAALLARPETHFDMVRTGIALYGHSPLPGAAGVDLRPVMTLKSRVCSVREMPAGAVLGYGCTHSLTRDSRVAVLPIGYADGLPRGLSGRAEVRFDSGRAPIVGRICMDLCMADVTELPGVRTGDVAEIFGPGLPVEEKAAALGTISYELLSAVSPRVPRVTGQLCLGID